MSGKHCGIFTCPGPMLSTCPKDDGPVPSVGARSLVQEGREQTLSVKRCLSALTLGLPEGLTKVLVFVSPDSTLALGGPPQKARKRSADTWSQRLS